VATYSFVASHRIIDLTTVALLSNGAASIPELFRTETAQNLGVTGTIVLATCNRLEIYVQLSVAEHLGPVSDMLYAEIAQKSELDAELIADSFEIYENLEAAKHLFTVASGLESAVVGEREIAGQVRRALASAQEEGTVPGELVQLFEHAAHTARQVGQHTTIGSQGRSIVSVALDLADAVAEKDWKTRRALVFGTGAYAGATIAALRERGCEDIWVNSRSGRAPEFAAKRDVRAVPKGETYKAMEQADVIVGCSGGSDPLSPAEIPPGHHTILDLALSRDFDPAIADLLQVELITLESVRLAAPEETEEAVATIRRCADELVTLIWYLTQYDETGQFPEKIKVDMIDSFLPKSQELLNNKHDAFLEDLRRLSNAHKHSFAQSDAHIIGADEPCVYLLSYPRNNGTKDCEFVVVPVRQLVDEFNAFLVNCLERVRKLGEDIQVRQYDETV